jgi:chromatin segregation and condensation protein Rec8/ScpA/Scc1 (kleisin family)
MEDQPYNIRELETGENPVVATDLLNTPEWRDVLDWYAYSGDPWEVSVRDTAQGFQEKLDEMNGDNLELSGRMVLTCAVILRAKAEGLKEEDESEEAEEASGGFDEGFWGYEEFDNENYVPDLDVPLKRIQERTISRNELSQAFDSAIKVHRRRKGRHEEEEEPEDQDWGMELQEESNFRVRLQRLYRKVKEKLSRGKEVLFSRLLRESTKEEKFEKFMELLHLQSEGKVKCKQEEPFSDIKVELAKEENQGSDTSNG